jgi:type III secretion system low calcium response chaperone LcrH/SycD
MSSESPAQSISIAQGFALYEYLSCGETLAEALGCSVKTQEGLYYLAYTFYNQAKYDDAMRVFAYLMTANHVDRRYHSGFGACLHMQQRYREALRHYAAASMLDLTDPGPVMHSAECYLALGDKAQARSSLAYALAQARAHERHHGFVPRLEAMLAFIDSEQQEKSNG